MRVEAIVARWRVGFNSFVEGDELGIGFEPQEEGHGKMVAGFGVSDCKAFRNKLCGQGFDQMPGFSVQGGGAGEESKMSWKGRGFEASG